MREHARLNLAGAPLMRARHPEQRGNEQKDNVTETELKIIVHPTVAAHKLGCSTARSMITIDSGRKNNNRKRLTARTSRTLTGPSFGIKRWGGYRALCRSSLPNRC
jgi:hypothetical protein